MDFVDLQIESFNVANQQESSKRMSTKVKLKAIEVIEKERLKVVESTTFKVVKEVSIYRIQEKVKPTRQTTIQI